ncbi:MAG: sugar transferase [Micavibrio aeruginosavorus]|uniref:Sugar transferase n=1 Tax=Micavibrio aeruginosavorus TaxID=349221 RepID=A0A7T5UGI0_9BACT|nr:MAG: sugar transferase [Micavibrio aeruginosavorus]
MSLKRVFDISAAAIGLAVLSPVFAILAAGGALHFRGNPFHLAHRVGKDGESFQMIKFKSMRDGTENDGSRTTGYGRFLRSTAMDELPQLFNILNGDMSFVGPRPREQIEHGDDRIPPSHRDILSVRPGLTGPWQVAAIGLKAPMPSEKRLDLDAAYARDTPSLGKDIKLILKTIPAFIKGHDGEYLGKPKDPMTP